MSDKSFLISTIEHACRVAFKTKRIDIIKPLKVQFTITDEKIKELCNEVEKNINKTWLHSSPKEYYVRPEYSVIEIANKLLPEYIEFKNNKE